MFHYTYVTISHIHFNVSIFCGGGQLSSSCEIFISYIRWWFCMRICEIPELYLRSVLMNACHILIDHSRNIISVRLGMGVNETSGNKFADISHASMPQNTSLTSHHSGINVGVPLYSNISLYLFGTQSCWSASIDCQHISNARTRGLKFLVGYVCMGACVKKKFI